MVTCVLRCTCTCTYACCFTSMYSGDYTAGGNGAPIGTNSPSRLSSAACNNANMELPHQQHHSLQGTVVGNQHNGSSYDTKYAKSFRHFTREALPRLDNYRNMMSIQAAYRPTLDELHDITLHQDKVSGRSS
jgi:hypothetical protein